MSSHLLDQFHLVYPEAEEKSVLIVADEGSKELQKCILECLNDTTATVQFILFKEFQSYELENIDLVVALQIIREDAMCVINEANRKIKPFIIYQSDRCSLRIFCDPLKEKCIRLRSDGLSVHVGSVSDSVDNTCIITCNRPHEIEENDSVIVGGVEMTVCEIVSDKVVKIKYSGDAPVKSDRVQPCIQNGIYSKKKQYFIDEGDVKISHDEVLYKNSSLGR